MEESEEMKHNGEQMLISGNHSKDAVAVAETRASEQQDNPIQFMIVDRKKMFLRALQIPLTIPRGIIMALPWAPNTCRVQPGWGGWSQSCVRSSQEPSHGWAWQHGEGPAQQGEATTEKSLRTIR